MNSALISRSNTKFLNNKTSEFLNYVLPNGLTISNQLSVYSNEIPRISNFTYYSVYYNESSTLSVYTVFSQSLDHLLVNIVVDNESNVEFDGQIIWTNGVPNISNNSSNLIELTLIDGTYYGKLIASTYVNDSQLSFNLTIPSNNFTVDFSKSFPASIEGNACKRSGLIDWGDGVIENFVGQQYHTYANAGDYSVTIAGECEGLGQLPAQITGVTELGNVLYFDKTFAYCNLITQVPAGIFNNIKNRKLQSVFQGSGITSIPDNLFPINNRLTELISNFAECRSLTSVGRNAFANLSSVYSFKSNFSSCESLDSVPIDLLYPLVNLIDIDWNFQGCGFNNSDIDVQSLLKNCTKIKNYLGLFSSGGSEVELATTEIDGIVKISYGNYISEGGQRIGRNSLGQIVTEPLSIAKTDEYGVVKLSHGILYDGGHVGTNILGEIVTGPAQVDSYGSVKLSTGVLNSGILIGKNSLGQLIGDVSNLPIATTTSYGLVRMTTNINSVVPTEVMSAESIKNYVTSINNLQTAYNNQSIDQLGIKTIDLGSNDLSWQKGNFSAYGDRGFRMILSDNNNTNFQWQDTTDGITYYVSQCGLAFTEGLNQFIPNIGTAVITRDPNSGQQITITHLLNVPTTGGFSFRDEVVGLGAVTTTTLSNVTGINFVVNSTVNDVPGDWSFLLPVKSVDGVLTGGTVLLKERLDEVAATVSTYGTVKLGTSVALTTSNGGEVGVNTSGQLLAKAADGSNYGTIKTNGVTTLGILAGYVGVSPSGVAGIAAASTNSSGTIRVSDVNLSGRYASLKRNSNCVGGISEASTSSYGAVKITSNVNSTIASEVLSASGVKDYINSNKLVVTNPLLASDGTSCTWTLSNTLGTSEVVISMYDITTNDIVYSNTNVTSSNIVVNILSDVDIQENRYKLIIIK